MQMNNMTGVDVRGLETSSSYTQYSGLFDTQGTMLFTKYQMKKKNELAESPEKFGIVWFIFKFSFESNTKKIDALLAQSPFKFKSVIEGPSESVVHVALYCPNCQCRGAGHDA